MLDSAGVDLVAPDPGQVLSVFRRFSEIPVEGVDDGFLYQIGVYAFGGPETFRLDLTRQFGFLKRGEYDRMEQLHCTIHYEPDDELRHLGAFNTWAYDYATLDAFYRAVESRPEWEVVRRKRPQSFEVDQEQV